MKMCIHNLIITRPLTEKLAGEKLSQYNITNLYNGYNGYNDFA